MSTEKIEALSKDILNERKIINEKLAIIDVSIQDRVNYIVNTICESFDETLACWYYPDANEGDVGDFGMSVYDDKINVIMELKKDGFIKFPILFNGKELDLHEWIPISWLTEDFEDILVKGKAAFIKAEENKKEKSKQKRLARKEKELKLLEGMKSKLTKEELKLLKKKKRLL